MKTWAYLTGCLIAIGIGAFAINRDVQKGMTTEDQICNAARAQKVECIITDARVVRTSDGGVFLVLDGKVYQLSK